MDAHSFPNWSEPGRHSSERWSRRGFDNASIFDSRGRGVANQPPTITSNPPLVASVATTLSYQIQAIDPEGTTSPTSCAAAQVESR